MISKNSIILLIAHGSRVPEANLEVHQLAERLQKKLERVVQACFLELGEPNIPEGVDLALKKSPREIVVLPYFLTQGRHVLEDIRAILAEKAKAYPETPLRLLDYVGAHPKMVELLKDLIEAGT